MLTIIHRSFYSSIKINWIFLLRINTLIRQDPIFRKCWGYSSVISKLWNQREVVINLTRHNQGTVPRGGNIWDSSGRVSRILIGREERSKAQRLESLGYGKPSRMAEVGISQEERLGAWQFGNNCCEGSGIPDIMFCHLIIKPLHPNFPLPINCSILCLVLIGCGTMLNAL